MWKRKDIDRNKRYSILLCQSPNRVRYCTLSELGGSVVNPDILFETEEVPTEPLETYNLEEIAKVKLLNGEDFVFDAHGVWFTKAEADALLDPYGRNPIPWINGVVPHLPPK